MTELKTGQLVRVNDIRSLAYGRVAFVLTVLRTKDVQVIFTDCPPEASSPKYFNSLIAKFSAQSLTVIDSIPVAALYLLVTIVERDGERRHTQRVLAYSDSSQSQESLANAIAKCWYEIGGEWDESEEVWRFGTHHFVLAEDWRELSVAEYANLATTLPDCTPSGQ